MASSAKRSSQQAKQSGGATHAASPTTLSFGTLQKPASAQLSDPAKAGAYHVWPANADGQCIGNIASGMPNPAVAAATEIYFGISAAAAPTKDQSDLQAAIGQVLSIVRTLYLLEGEPPRPQFRLFYTRLFRVAQLGLEANAMPDIAKGALAQITTDLIDAEACRVKNAHLAALGSWALGLACGFAALYLLLCVGAVAPLFVAIGVQPVMARAFMILWIGCFAGVWLSYAIRKTTFTLRDLVVTDADRLLPFTRLVFAGLLTMTLGLILVLGFADAKIGGHALSSFVTNSTEALLLGLFCGVSELLLPNMIGKRAEEMVARIR